MAEALDYLNVNDLNEEQTQLAELIGIENFRKMVKNFGGMAVYIPKADSFVEPRNVLIRQEFDGYNYRELAKKYKLTEIWIRKIVENERKQIKAMPSKDQLSFF